MGAHFKKTQTILKGRWKRTIFSVITTEVYRRDFELFEGRELVETEKRSADVPARKMNGYDGRRAGLTFGDVLLAHSASMP